MATGFCCASSRFRKIAWRFNKARYTRRCTAWSTRAGSPANGASRKTSGRRNITVLLRQESADFKQKPKNGTAWQKSSPESCTQHRRKCEALEPTALLATGHVWTRAHGKRHGRRDSLSHGNVRRGLSAERRVARRSDAASANAVWSIDWSQRGMTSLARRAIP